MRMSLLDNIFMLHIELTYNRKALIRICGQFHTIGHRFFPMYQFYGIASQQLLSKLHEIKYSKYCKLSIWQHKGDNDEN